MRPQISTAIYQTLLIALILLLTSRADSASSHPPLRQTPPPAKRPMDSGPAVFVDAQRGDDRQDGSVKTPWRTLQHAVRTLKAGDTVYLRGGVYRENVSIARAGRADAPITIRSYPGEQAILDGSLAEFFETPADAWEPVSGGGKGEFRSKRSYPNLREVIGSFGDSMIGLQTYYHLIDFRSENEFVEWQDPTRRDQTDIKPLWRGPGLYYDRDSGRIHVRLAHTHLPEPISNYQGETDPRKLPLLLSSFSSLVLHLDGAQHVRLQDLVIRGAGYCSVVLDQASHVDFDNVTIWCGTYGMRVGGTRHFRFHRSAMYGNVAPWTFRSDGSKRDYPGRPHRNISRLNTHAHLELDAGRESSVYATPQNDHWEISYTEFTDAHDGPYLAGINVRFHHNLIENLQDDGLYLSPMYHRHRLDKTDPEIHIYENVFRTMLTALAFGGSEPVTRDQIYIYRNLFDLQQPFNTGRPAPGNAPGLSTGKVMGDHGSPPWPTMYIYHNTMIARGSRSADMSLFSGTRDKHPRRVFNNLFVHLDRLPGFAIPQPEGNVVADGNLYATTGVQASAAEAFFKRFRNSPAFAESKKLYPPGSTSSSLVADPRLSKDARLPKDSPAVDAGVAIPEQWPDPLRKLDQGKPDIGAIPLGAAPLKAGRAS